MRSKLWDIETQVKAGSLPKPGEILAWLSGNKVGGKAYDDGWEERAEKTLW